MKIILIIIDEIGIINIDFENKNEENLVKDMYIIRNEKVYYKDNTLINLNSNQLFFNLSKSNYPIFIIPSNVKFYKNSLKNLVNILLSDPLYGFAIPRTLNFGTAPLYKIHEKQISNDETKKFISKLPQINLNYIFKKLPILIKPFMIQEFFKFETNFLNSILNLTLDSNKRGFLTVTVNSSYIDVNDLYIEQNISEDNNKIKERIGTFFKNNTDIIYESIIRTHFINKTHKSVLFDIRNLQPGFNGTAVHILSLINPLIDICLKNNFKPFFWCNSEAIDFHKLEDKCFFSDIPDNDCYDVAVRLSQPWSFGELIDFIKLSPVNIYFFLDAIAYDCSYLRMNHLESLWENVSRFSDGFIFNSNYTKDRILNRFPDARKSLHKISYCSLDVNDYQKSNIVKIPKNYILIVGNMYYHKDLEDTISLLSASFPNYKYKVLGYYKNEYSNVELIESGNIDQTVVENLYSNAKLLIFPSYYEGFGLPILTSMSYKVPVIARESSLIEEIRTNVNSNTPLLTYINDIQLLERIKELYVKSKKDDSLVNIGKTVNWYSSAYKIYDLINELLSAKNYTKCKDRINFLNTNYILNNEIQNWQDHLGINLFNLKKD